MVAIDKQTYTMIDAMEIHEETFTQSRQKIKQQKSNQL